MKAHCRKPRVQVLYHTQNQGVGGAVKTGYRQALCDGANVVVKVDGDGQMDPLLIPHFIKPILDGDADYTKETGSTIWSIYAACLGFTAVRQCRAVSGCQAFNGLLERF